MKTMMNLIALKKLKQDFARRRNKLYRIAYSWCHEAALADDLVQEAMYKAMKNAHRLRDTSTIDTWLYRILINCWHDYLRIKGRHVELQEMTDDHQAEHSDRYQQTQIVERVRDSVSQLPMPLREVVTLADFAGMSYSQIAEIVEIPIGTVMSRLFRARKNLKEHLLDLGKDENAHFRLRRVK